MTQSTHRAQMLSATQKLHQVSLLLSALPGVAVKHLGVSEEQLSIGITTQGASAAYLVRELCALAVVCIEPPMDLKNPPYAIEREWALSFRDGIAVDTLGRLLREHLDASPR